MLRRTALVLLLVLCPSGALGQSASTDSQTLQALLVEIRQLRQDLQVVAHGACRAQILIHRLYVQEAAVARASQRLDEAKAELDQFQGRKKYLAAQIKTYEDLRDRSGDAAQRKQFDDYISNMKAQMEALLPDEQDVQAKETELEELWRIEQSKLDQLQEELDQIDRTVMSATKRGAATPP